MTMINISVFLHEGKSGLSYDAKLKKKTGKIRGGNVEL